MNGSIYGIPIYENRHLTVEGEPYERTRTWKERLFTRPWRPLRRTVTVVPQVPDPNFYVSEGGVLGGGKCIFAHPATAHRIKVVAAESEKVVAEEAI